MVYPFIKQEGLNALTEYLGEIDSENLKRRIAGPDFELNKNEILAFEAYRLLLVMEFNRLEDEKRQQYKESFTPGRAEIQARALESCAKDAIQREEMA